MGRALLIAVPGGVLITGILYYLTERLSGDAVAMMIGLFFGVFALFPTVLLILSAANRDREDQDYDDRRVDRVVVVLPTGARPALPESFSRYLDGSPAEVEPAFITRHGVPVYDNRGVSPWGN